MGFEPAGGTDEAAADEAATEEVAGDDEEEGRTQSYA